MRVGDRVEVKIDNEWYPGRIVSRVERCFTVRVLYTDYAFGDPALIPGADEFIRLRETSREDQLRDEADRVARTYEQRVASIWQDTVGEFAVRNDIDNDWAAELIRDAM